MPAEENEQPKLRFTWLLSASSLVFVAMVGWHLSYRGMQRWPAAPRWAMPGADPERGRVAIVRYGCGACHVIPGVRGASGRVGPQLVDFANQIYVGGMLTNVPENLVRWIRFPQEVSPGTAMPNLGVSESEARDIAAYIYAATADSRGSHSPAAESALPAQSTSRF